MLKNALEQPFRILLANAGLNPDEWLPQVKAGKPGFGVDVNNPIKLVDLKSAGIVDPARVTKEAIQNAASIAGTCYDHGRAGSRCASARSSSRWWCPRHGWHGRHDVTQARNGSPFVRKGNKKGNKSRSKGKLQEWELIDVG